MPRSLTHTALPGIALFSGVVVTVASWLVAPAPVPQIIVGHGAEALAAARWLAAGQLPPEPVDALASPGITLLSTLAPTAALDALSSGVAVGAVLLAAWGCWALSGPDQGRVLRAGVALVVVGAVAGATGAAGAADPVFIGLAAVLASVGAVRTRRRALAVGLGLGAGLVAWPAWAGLLIGRGLPDHRWLKWLVVATMAVATVVSVPSGPSLAVALSGLSLIGIQALRTTAIERHLMVAAGASAIAVLVVGDGIELALALLAAATLPGLNAGLGWSVAALTVALGGAATTVAFPPQPPVDLWQSKGALEALHGQLEAGETAAVVRFSDQELRRAPLELQARLLQLSDLSLVLASSPTGPLEEGPIHPAPTWAWVGWEDAQAGPALAWIQDHADLEGAITWYAEHDRGGVVVPLGAHSHAHHP